MKLISIYKSVDSRDSNAEYYEAYLAPYGLIATIHSFGVFPDGVITLIVSNRIVTSLEVKNALKAYKDSIIKD